MHSFPAGGAKDAECKDVLMCELKVQNTRSHQVFCGKPQRKNFTLSRISSLTGVLYDIIYQLFFELIDLEKL